jgi:hypothetical protein
VRFLPLGFPAPGVYEPWLGLAGLGGLTATGAVAEFRGPGGIFGGLSLKRDVEHLFGENLPKRDDEVFQFRQ